MSFRIQELLATRKMTQAALAQAAKVRAATINEIVNGKGNPRLSTLQDIARVLEVEVWELFSAAPGAATPEDLQAAISDLAPEDQSALLTLLRRRGSPEDTVREP